MGIISRLGHWLDTRFPEKISAEEVYKSLTAYQNLASDLSAVRFEMDRIREKFVAYTNGAQAFDKDLKDVKDELNKVKSVQAMMNKVRSSPVLNSSDAWKR